jgi:hypothetical protein
VRCISDSVSQLSESKAVTLQSGITYEVSGNVVIVDYVTVVSGIGGSYATLTFAPDAAVGIESATVLIERVCG